eukprot:3093139-Alexandrium_andersonii.AAC.1
MPDVARWLGAYQNLGLGPVSDHAHARQHRIECRHISRMQSVWRDRKEPAFSASRTASRSLSWP